MSGKTATGREIPPPTGGDPEHLGDIACSHHGHDRRTSDRTTSVAAVMAGQAGGETAHASALARALELGPAYDYQRAEVLWNMWAQAWWAGRRPSDTAAELLAVATETGN